MTRAEKIQKLQRQYLDNRRNHKPSAVIWEKLHAVVNRDLLISARALRRERKGRG